MYWVEVYETSTSYSKQYELGASTLQEAKQEFESSNLGGTDSGIALLYRNDYDHPLAERRGYFGKWINLEGYYACKES